LNLADNQKSISKIFMNALDHIYGERISFVEKNEAKLSYAEKKLKAHHSVYDNAH
jgi:hypothetical protein